MTARSDDPREEYSRRLEDRCGRVRVLERRDARVAFARLAVAIAVVAAAIAAWRSAAVSWVWVAPPIATFVALVVVHDRVLRAKRLAERSVRFYRAGLARLDDRWAGNGSDGAGLLDDDHPYAGDLDLFGPGSLFELVNSTRTAAGERALAGWLLAPAAPDVVRERQRAVAELRDRLDLREDLALLGEEIRSGVRPDRTTSWAAAPAVLSGSAPRAAAAALAALAVAGLLAWWRTDVGPVPALVALAAEAGFALAYRRRVRRVVEAVDAPVREIELLGLVLARIERERFEAPMLRALRRRLDSGGVPPSAAVRSLARRVDLLEARRNQLFQPVAIVLLWTTQLAFALEAWRARHGAAAGGWVESVSEFEALVALAGYAFEHPADPFPDVEDGPPRLHGRGLGHPLLPEERVVRNDVRLDDAQRLLLVSGSNMSGKSTLLRTVGVNVVLALAGAPVRAEALELSPLALAATLRVHDSLREGESRFYAEIRRLRATIDRAGAGLAVLFLFDELLAGTNSHDRAVGAEAILRGLLDRGAIGLVTTHDLALAALADALAPRASNVHFEDRLEDGRMVFDYRLRPGVVTRSNALALMRAVGIDVGRPAR